MLTVHPGHLVVLVAPVADRAAVRADKAPRQPAAQRAQDRPWAPPRAVCVRPWLDWIAMPLGQLVGPVGLCAHGTPPTALARGPLPFRSLSREHTRVVPRASPSDTLSMSRVPLLQVLWAGGGSPCTRPPPSLHSTSLHPRSGLLPTSDIGRLSRSLHGTGRCRGFVCLCPSGKPPSFLLSREVSMGVDTPRWGCLDRQQPPTRPFAGLDGLSSQ